jgi:hypothetical protein
VDFRVYPLWLRFVACERIHFPAGKAANVLRGALGMVLPRQAARSKGPSGLADEPSPFVFRAAHLNGVTVSPGESFQFAVNVFDGSLTGKIAIAFEQLTSEGLGPGRGRAELVEALPEKLVLSLDPGSELVSQVRVRFVTPTELKSGQQVAERPEFGVLAARIRDRISTLCALYGDGPLKIDFRAFGERATRVRMVRCDITHVAIERRSSRTGQKHPIGGFVGEAEYEGELTEFVPYLQAAKWTGVGRQTVWGKGMVEVG